MRLLLHFCLCLVTLLATGASLSAQDFLRANYAASGRPSQLNVCGDADRAIYRVERSTGAPTSSAIQATVRLFRGVRAVGLDATRSSAGVSVISLADPTRPVISLPNISAGNPAVEFALILEARCGILDTIRLNNSLDVRDQIDLRFTAVGQSRSERETVDPYLAAISFPVFTLSTSLSESPLRVGQSVTRRVEVANGSFRGYADTVRYVLEQGRGASLRALRVNGVAQAFAKTVSGTGDTLITVTLAGTSFVDNRNGVFPGNGDQRFDPDERLFIEEDLLIVNCSEVRLARHTVAFGCDATACAVTEVQSNLPIGSGQPSLVISRAATFPDVQVGYCQEGEMRVWVSNLGRESDPGFGEARGLAVSAIADFSGGLVANGYRVTRIHVAGMPLPSLAAVTRLDTVAVFAADPDGPGGGLADLDGDGYFDDLGLRDSFEITVFFEFDCGSAQVYDLDENCANDAATTFQAYAYYDDACLRRLSGAEPSVYSPRNLQDDFQQRTQPDAFAEGPAFQVELEFGRLVFDFANSCSAAAELRAYVVLPQGVNIDPLTSSLNRGGPGMPLVGVTYSADTAMLRFSPAAEAALSGEYTLTLGLLADCTAALGETIFPTSVAYYCPDCDCEHLWICEELIGPWIHKTAPPCPIASLLPCPQGIQGTSFSIDRTTLGYYDPAFTNPYASSDANTKVAIPADSVRIVMGGIVGDNVVTDSLGVMLYYLSPNNMSDTVGLFLMGGARMHWKDGLSWRTCDLPATAHELQVNEKETWQRFDIGACLTANGWSLNPGDSIRFEGMFEINPDGPILSTYKFVGDLRGGFYAVEDGTETLCDQFGDNFRVGKPLTVFGVPSSGDYPKGCNVAAIDFRLSGINRGYVEEFGSEYRRSARLDSLILNFDTAIFSAFDSVRVELFVADHPTQGSAFFPIRPLSDFPDGRYVLRLDSLDHSAELVSNHNYLYNLRVWLQPNCSSIRSSSNDDAFYEMRAEPYYRDRYYARDIGTGERVLSIAEDIPFTMGYEDPAQLALDMLTPPYQRIVNDSAFVEIEICNTSDRSDAGRGWVVFDDTRDLSVEEAWLIDDLGNPVALVIDDYSGGHYVNVEGLKRVDGVNTSAQVCNVLRFKVRTVGCGVNSLRFGAGWGCESSVPVGWTPDADPACVDDWGLSTFEPIAPFLEADLISQPLSPVDLCGEVTLEFQVNNARPGTAYDVVSTFYAPPGFVYVPGSIEVAYPPSAAYQATVTELVSTDTTIRGFGLEFADLADVHPYLGENGLAGFDANVPTDSNRFRLRARFSSDCSYRSGSLVYFDAVGTEACGEATNLAATESAAIAITGVEADGSHLFEVGVDPAARLSLSGAISRLEVVARHVGTVATDAEDFFEVSLPRDFAYVANSSQGVEPGGYVVPEPLIRTIGGVTTLQYSIPVGLLPGESFRLSFEVAGSNSDCDASLALALTTVRFQTATCVSGGFVCRIPTDVTRGGSTLTTVTAGDGFIAEYGLLSSTCASASDELLEIRMRLSTTGFTLDGSPVEAALYFDESEDGAAGPGDELIATVSLANAPGDLGVDFSYTGQIARSKLGGLILRIDSTGLPICRPQEIAIPLAPLSSVGAVDLFRVCVNENAVLNLGDNSCTGASGVDFTWTSWPGGHESFLSDVKAPAPTLTIASPYFGPDTLYYILASERSGLGVTTDTVAVVVSPGVVLGEGGSITISYGDQLVLQPDVQQGRAPFTFDWSPSASLSSATEPQPIASPKVSTSYVLTVTDGVGCVGMSTYDVVVSNPITPTATFTDTTICPDQTILLEITNGGDVTWSADPANPSPGELSALSGASVEFDPAGGQGFYAFTATVSDPAFPTYSDTVTIRINVDPGADCGQVCELPQLRSETVINTDCQEANGIVSISFTDDIADFNLLWTNEGGDTVAQATTILTNLSPGVYRLAAAHRTQAGCTFEYLAYVSAADGPEPSVTTTDATCRLADGTATIATGGIRVVWPDGSTAQSRNDLFPGTYRVGVATLASPLCVRYLNVEIGQSTELTIDYRVDQKPTCGIADGAVTLSVSGGSGDYVYGWRGGNPQNGRLRAGAYTIEVVDRVTLCRGTISFVLSDDVPGGTVIVASAVTESCAGSADGHVAYELTVDPAAVLPLDSAWFNESGDTVVNGRFTRGIYCLVLRDAAGCVAGGVCTDLAPPAPIQVDLDIESACGPEGGSVVVYVRNGRAPLTYIYDDGTVTTENRMSGFPPGDRLLTIEDAAGCTVTVPFTVSPCGSCGLVSTAGDTVQLQSTCGSTAALCIPGIAQRAPNLVIHTNGSVYADRVEPCDYARTRLSYLLGVYSFNRPVEAVWSVDGIVARRTVQTLSELIQFFQEADPAGGWTYDPATLSLSGGQASGSYAVLTLQRSGSSLVTTIPYSERIEPLGLAIRLVPGFHQVVVFDTVAGCSDTLYANVGCTRIDTMRVIVSVDSTRRFCLPTAEIGGGLPVTIRNICPDSTFATYQVLTDNCLTVTGVSVGEQAGCWEVCNAAGVCDTILLLIRVLPDSTLRTWRDTIFVGESDALCLSVGELGLPGTRLTISNTCAGSSGTAVSFSLDDVTGCVDFEGLSVGAESACLRICDESGFCVSGTYTVTVVPRPVVTAIVARDDSTCTTRDMAVRLLVLENDSIPAPVTDLRLLTSPDPNDGAVVVNADRTFTFTPAPGVCGRTVTFSYEVCTGAEGSAERRCAEATVEVCIRCDGFKIFTAISPNGDGLNESFFVEGLDEFPDNELQVFNRWGNLVYQARGYGNDWRGTYDGNPLPDGAYFYILDVTAGGETTSYNGYVEIMR